MCLQHITAILAISLLCVKDIHGWPEACSPTCPGALSPRVSIYEPDPSAVSDPLPPILSTNPNGTELAPMALALNRIKRAAQRVNNDAGQVIQTLQEAYAIGQNLVSRLHQARTAPGPMNVDRLREILWLISATNSIANDYAKLYLQRNRAMQIIVETELAWDNAESAARDGDLSSAEDSATLAEEWVDVSDLMVERMEESWAHLVGTAQAYLDPESEARAMHRDDVATVAAALGHGLMLPSDPGGEDNVDQSSHDESDGSDSGHHDAEMSNG